MPQVIRLDEFIEEIDRVSEEVRVYLNIQTGRFTSLSGEAVSAAEALKRGKSVPAWQKSMVQDAVAVLSSDDYRELPDQFDVHEYAIMQRFCNTVADDELRHRLMRSLQGRGASMRIRSTVQQYGMEVAWSGFRKEALRGIAIEWLEQNGVAYTDEA